MKWKNQFVVKNISILILFVAGFSVFYFLTVLCMHEIESESIAAFCYCSLIAKIYWEKSLKS